MSTAAGGQGQWSLRYTFPTKGGSTRSPFFTCELGSSIQTHMSTFNAADLIIEPTDLPHYDIFSDIPSKISLPDGEIKFFKPLRNKEEFKREVLTANRIVAAGLDARLRISRLHGIVLAHGSKNAIGLIFDYIPSAFGNLGGHSGKTSHADVDEWEQQVVQTVGVLHEHDIIWGDVNPGNIMVDDHNDAWIVDFGGGFVEGFVSREKAGIKEGDLEGIRNVFEHVRGDATLR